MNRFEAGLAAGGAGDQYYYDSFLYQRHWYDIVPDPSRFLDSIALADPDRVMIQAADLPTPPDGPVYEEPVGGGGSSLVFDMNLGPEAAGMSRVDLEACAREIGGAYVVDDADGPRLRLERPLDVLCSADGEVRGVHMPVSLGAEKTPEEEERQDHSYMDASTNPEDVRLDMLMRAGTSVPWEDAIMPEAAFVEAMLAEEAEIESAATAASSMRRNRRRRTAGRGVTAAAATTKSSVGTSHRELASIQSSITERRAALTARRKFQDVPTARREGEALDVNHAFDTILSMGISSAAPVLAMPVGDRSHYQSVLRSFAARPFFFVSTDEEGSSNTVVEEVIDQANVFEEPAPKQRSRRSKKKKKRAGTTEGSARFRVGTGRQKISKADAVARDVKNRTSSARFGNNMRDTPMARRRAALRAAETPTPAGLVTKPTPHSLKSMYVKNNKRRGKDRASSLMRHQEAVVRQNISAEHEAEGVAHLRRYMNDAGVRCATSTPASATKLPYAGEWLENNTDHHYKVPTDVHSRHKSKDQRAFTGKPRFEIRKINPYVREESGGFRSDTPPVQVYTMLEEDLGLTRAAALEWFPRWVAAEFEGQVRPWLCEGVDYEAYTWYPVRLHDQVDLSAYSIYCTLVSRIHALDEMQRRPGVHHKLRVQLCLWQDTHQLLALFMEATGFFRDDQLRTPADFAYILEDAVRAPEPPVTRDRDGPEWLHRYTSLLEEVVAEAEEGEYEEDESGPTYADVFRPSLAHVMHEGELPDLTKVMMYVSLWQDTEDSHSGILDLDVELLMETIGKALPRPQQSRDMYQITARRIDSYARYKDCITRWLAMSQMGLYESTGARVVSNFYVRHEVYRSLSFTPTSPADLARWMNGFECEDLSRENMARSMRGRGSGSGNTNSRRSASTRDPATGLTKDGRFSGKLPPVYAVTSDWEGASEVERVETRGMCEINPKLLVGNNEPKARAGFCNMTSHTQFMITEYLVMLIRANPGMHDALCRLYAFEDVYGEMVEDMDNVRRIYNAFFVDEEMPAHVKGRDVYAEYAPAGGERPLLGGRAYLRAMVNTFVPYLDWSCMDECAQLMAEPRRNRTFQSSIMPSGVVGDTLWNARTMILAEALLYCCRKRTLPLWSCYMKVPFRRHALAQFTKIEVRVGKRGGSELEALIAEERAMPAEHRAVIDRVIRYVLGHGRPRKTPSYEWMVAAFDLTMHPILFLALTELHYREENFSKTVANVILRIYETFPREFQYIKYFLRTLEREASVFVYDLPRSVTIQQAHALHESHALVARGQPLPPNADLAWYCPAHLDFKHPLADEHPDTPFHRGTVHTVVCPWTYELLCKFENITTSSRKRGSGDTGNGGGDGDEDSVVRRVYTNHNDNLEMQACARLRLRQVHMLGKVLRLKHDFFVACPFCWTYTFLSLDKFNTRLGFACPSCAAIINRDVSYRLEDYYRFRCVQCTDSALYKVNQVYRHVVYDDTRKDRAPFWRIAYFCRAHNRRFIGESATTTSLSNIQLYLARRVYPKRVQNERGEWDHIFMPEASLERYTRAVLNVIQKAARRKRRLAEQRAEAAEE